MDCGIDFDHLLSYIGLADPNNAEKSSAGTPSTVGLDKDYDDDEKRDAAILAASKQLTYGICLPAECSPASKSKDSVLKKEFKFSGCNPQNCRMNAGICIDCTYCHIHCICDGNEKRMSPNRLSIRNKQGLLANATGNSRQQLQLRKSPSMLSDSSSEGSVGNNNKSRKSKTPSPSKSFILKNDKKGPRYDMEEDGGVLYLSHRMLKEHTNRSNRSYRSESSGSQQSYMSYNSNKTGSSSRRRYNFGDEDENVIYQTNNNRRTRTRGHRRSNSNHSGTSGSRKSSTSFSLLSRGKKKQTPTKSSKGSSDPIIGKTFSFDSTNSHSSAGLGSVLSGADRTRGSATTARRRNSHTQGGSLSSSSRSYLDGSDVEAEAAAAGPKKSWFRRRLESKE